MAVISSETAIVAGNALMTSGVLADITLFQDKGYIYLSVIGAFISTFGVIHELATSEVKNITKSKIMGEILKGMAIGILAIPFWYLLLSTIGDKLIYKFFNIQSASKFSNTFWFIISFYLSWYSVPIFDWIVKKLPERFKND
jgi:hypothetical protein